MGFCKPNACFVRLNNKSIGNIFEMLTQFTFINLMYYLWWCFRFLTLITAGITWRWVDGFWPYWRRKISNRCIIAWFGCVLCMLSKCCCNVSLTFHLLFADALVAMIKYRFCIIGILVLFTHCCCFEIIVWFRAIASPGR